MTTTTNYQQELDIDFEMTFVQGSTKQAMKTNGDSSRDLWQVSVDKIRLIPGFNTRIKNARYHERVRLIANSILQDGFKQEHPLAGYVAKEGDDNVIYLYAGHRRFEAVQIAISEGAEITKVPFVVAPPGTSQEDLTVDLVTGNGGEELAPFEIAVVCKRLVRYGWDKEMIASRIGMSEKYVSDLLLLISSPLVIRNMVINGQVAATKAIDLLHKHGDKAAAILEKSLEVAISSGKSKVTDKHTPGAFYKKVVTKSGPVLVETLKIVKSDPGFASLSVETQTKLAELLQHISDAESSETTAAD